MTFGQVNDTPLGHGQQLCEISSRSNLTVRSYGPDTYFGYVCTVTLTLEIWPWVRSWYTLGCKVMARTRCEHTDGQTDRVIPIYMIYPYFICRGYNYWVLYWIRYLCNWRVPVKCETKQKRNGTKRQIETKRNKSKRNRSKRNETNRNETKQNETKQIETKWIVWNAKLTYTQSIRELSNSIG